MAQKTKWHYGFAEYDGSAIHRRIHSMDDVAATSDALVPFMIAAGRERLGVLRHLACAYCPIWPRGSTLDSCAVQTANRRVKNVE